MKAYPQKGICYLLEKEFAKPLAARIFDSLGRHFGEGEIILGYASQSARHHYQDAIKTLLAASEKVSLIKLGKISEKLFSFLLERTGSTGGAYFTSANKKNVCIKFFGKNAKPLSQSALQKIGKVTKRNV